jgi:hypothetical protein
MENTYGRKSYPVYHQTMTTLALARTPATRVAASPSSSRTATRDSCATSRDASRLPGRVRPRNGLLRRDAGFQRTTSSPNSSRSAISGIPRCAQQRNSNGLYARRVCRGKQGRPRRDAMLQRLLLRATGTGPSDLKHDRHASALNRISETVSGYGWGQNVLLN